jgi:integrase
VFHLAGASAQATDIDVLVANRRFDLLAVDPAELAEFRRWKSDAKENLSISQASSAFVALKAAKSSRHRLSLECDLKLFTDFIGPTKAIGAVTALDIQRFISSRNVGQRRQFNLRCAIISLFRWARRMSYLPDRTTESEKVEPIEKVPGKPNVLTPEQMQTLLAQVREDYRPWLCVAAFAGIRTEEIAPDRKSKKSPLKWEDVDWQHKVIIVRAETAKTACEREVPLPDNLAAWLAPYSQGGR